MNTQVTMKSEIRDITPEVAKEMLRRNNKNRRCNESHVKNLRDQMLSGDWLFDGQPLRFSESGTMLDGQHRLTALVESGTTQKFLVLSGIHSDAFKVMDTGKNRSGADAFYMAGHNYSVQLATSCKLIINLQNGEAYNGGHLPITNSQILRWYGDNDELLDFIKIAHPLSKEFSNVLPTSWIATFLFVFSKKNITEAEIFMGKLCSGLDLTPKSPIYILRKRLLEDKMSVARLRAGDKKALIIKAWNLYRKGAECKFIRWDKNTEKFPTAI